LIRSEEYSRTVFDRRDSRRLCFGIVVGLVASACAKTEPARAQPPSTGVAKSIASEQRPTTDSSPPASEPPEARAQRVTSGLGRQTLQSLDGFDRAEAARLRVVAVSEAERNTFKTADRIVGYPADTPFRSVAAPNTARLLEILTRDASYDFDIAIRCANSRLVGIRFLTAPAVEVAIGTPCNQVIWAYHSVGGTGRWGAVLSKEGADALIPLLSSIVMASR
jgi:hypothetical protein